MPLFTKPIPIDKTRIEQEIVQVETYTSAELRVYIERKIPKNMSVFDRNLAVFNKLEMAQTAQRNGVLIYIAFTDHFCSILGDEGIHQYVGDAFWQQVNHLMIEQFKQQHYSEGIVQAIQTIGRELAKYFPVQKDDINELPNEVVMND